MIQLVIVMLLRSHSGGRLLNGNNNISDEAILQTVRANPSSTFVTASRSASYRVNKVVCRNFFLERDLLGIVPLDGYEEPCPI